MRILATLGVTTILLLSANVSAQQANDQIGGAGAAIANSTVTPAVSGDKTATSSPSQAGDQPANTTEALQKATQNPVADLISVLLQDNSKFAIAPNNRTQNVLNIQAGITS